MKKVLVACIITIIMAFLALLSYSYLFIPLKTAKAFIELSYSLNYQNMENVLFRQNDFFTADFIEFLSTQKIIDKEVFQNDKLMMRICSPIRFNKVKFGKAIISANAKFQINISNLEKTIDNYETINLVIVLKRIKWNEYKISFIRQVFS